MMSINDTELNKLLSEYSFRKEYEGHFVQSNVPETIYVIARSHVQANFWIRENNYQRRNCIYVSCPEKLRGVGSGYYVVLGEDTWRRRDFSEIMDNIDYLERLGRIKPLHKFFDERDNNVNQ